MSEKFREAIKAQAERQTVPGRSISTQRTEKDDIANEFRRRRAKGIRVFSSVLHGRRWKASAARTWAAVRQSLQLFVGESNCASTVMSGRNDKGRRAGICHTALYNGFLSCAESSEPRQICDFPRPKQIALLFQKWLTTQSGARLLSATSAAPSAKDISSTISPENCPLESLSRESLRAGAFQNCMHSRIGLADLVALPEKVDEVAPGTVACVDDPHSAGYTITEDPLEEVDTDLANCSPRSVMITIDGTRRVEMMAILKPRKAFAASHQ
jgi:hypothetical protein